MLSQESTMKYSAVSIALALVSTILILFSAGNSAAQRPLVVICDLWPPYEFEKDGRMTGFATEVIERAMQRAGIPHTQIKGYIWRRAMEIFSAGQADVLFAGNRTPERERIAFFPAVPLVESTWGLWTRDTAISSLDDLKGKRIGVVTGYSYTPAFWDYIHTHCLVEAVHSDKLNFRKLEQGRLFAVAADMGNGSFLAREMGASSLRPNAAPVIKSEGLYALFNRKTVPESVVMAFSAALQQMRTTPEYRRIYARYFSTSPYSVPDR